MKKEFKEKIKMVVMPFLYKGLRGQESCISVAGFRKCPYNHHKPCKAIHDIKVSNKKIVEVVTKLFLDKIK